jgi:hypothetical protein
MFVEYINCNIAQDNTLLLAKNNRNVHGVKLHNINKVEYNAYVRRRLNYLKENNKTRLSLVISKIIVQQIVSILKYIQLVETNYILHIKTPVFFAAVILCVFLKACGTSSF